MKIEAITNPWLNITSDNIAACDAEYFDSYGPVQKNMLIISIQRWD